MAVVSLIALLAALAAAALISLLPWAPPSVAPQLGLAPGIGVDLDDAVALPPGRQVAVAPARPAGSGERRLVADASREGEGASAPALGVAAARIVARSVAGPPPASPEESPAPEPAPVAPPPPAAPSPPASSAPAAVPVAAPVPSPSEPAPPAPPGRTPIGGGRPGGPGSAGIGPVEPGPGEPVEVKEGDELALSFLFYIEPTVYRPPGEENLILRLGNEEPSFGLQLWDDGSGEWRGLWTSSEAMGGERFLAPVAEGVWHRVTIYLRASSSDDGFYLLILDGEPIDARAWISLIDAESGDAQLEIGLFRDGERLAGAPDVFFGPAKLGDSLESVIP